MGIVSPYLSRYCIRTESSHVRHGLTNRRFRSNITGDVYMTFFLFLMKLKCSVLLIRLDTTVNYVSNVISFLNCKPPVEVINHKFIHITMLYRREQETHSKSPSLNNSWCRTLWTGFASTVHPREWKLIMIILFNCKVKNKPTLYIPNIFIYIWDYKHTCYNMLQYI